MARSSSRRTRRRRQSQPGRANVPATQSAAAQTSLPAQPAPDPTVTARPRRSTPRPVEQVGQGRRRSLLYRWTHPRYVIDIIDELRKVVWPSKDETRSLTTVVIIVALAVGALLGSVDWVFSRLLENVLLP